MTRTIVDLDGGTVVALPEAEYTLALQRSLLALIDLAKVNGLNGNSDVAQAKELIRCRVLKCGMAGACNGRGLDEYPCPLRKKP